MSPVHSYALAVGGVLMSASYFGQEALGDRLGGVFFAVVLAAHVIGVLSAGPRAGRCHFRRDVGLRR